MRHTSIFQRLMQQPLEEARHEALQQGKEIGREEGREEGIELGMTRGREQGARGTAIDALMNVLDARFQDRDVQFLKPLFEGITDVQHLNQLLRTAAQAATLDEVTRMLVPHRNNGP